jgi:zinc transport system ATP-binding protein
VREIVASGRLARVRPWRRFSDVDHDAIAAAIEAVGLTARARVPVGKLSGGQQRRVLIARALAGQPDVLVLDEPTAGVDAPSQEALATILTELCSRGLTVVLIAHELGPVAPLVTRVVVMSHGAVAFDGLPTAAPDNSWGGDEHHAHGDPRVTRPAVGLIGDR